MLSEPDTTLSKARKIARHNIDFRHIHSAIIHYMRGEPAEMVFTATLEEALEIFNGMDCIYRVTPIKGVYEKAGKTYSTYSVTGTLGYENGPELFQVLIMAPLSLTPGDSLNLRVHH